MTTTLAPRNVVVVKRQQEPGALERGARIRELRDRLGYSQTGAAALMEPPMSQGWWADLETGRGSANPHQLTELARVLRTSVSFLLFETDDPSPIKSRMLTVREKADVLIADLENVEDDEALDVMFQLQDEVRRRAERMRRAEADGEGEGDAAEGDERPDRDTTGPDVA